MAEVSAGAPHGVVAEFATPEALLAATKAVRATGFGKLDAHSPFPIPGLGAALGPTRHWIAPIVLAGGLLGGAGAYFMQYFAMGIHYPLNVGGRPLHSWPAFIPITFELTVLGASILGLLGMLALNRFPQPHHPLFAIPGFERASIDRFFLSIETSEPLPESVRRLLLEQGALRIEEVPQ